jgi:hypothetical protein
MTTNIRAEILRVLGELSDIEPETRFGQLVVNLSYLARAYTNEAIWDVEDEEFLAAAQEHLTCRRAALVGDEDPDTDLPQPASGVPAVDARLTNGS